MQEKKKYMEIPIIKSIQSIENIENKEYKDYQVIYFNNINNYNGTKNFYAYKLKDETMSPKFLKGDIIIFEKTTMVSSLDICVVKIANEEMIIRRLIKFDNGICLEPLNQEFNTSIYTFEEPDKKVKIVGKVVNLIRNF